MTIDKSKFLCRSLQNSSGSSKKAGCYKESEGGNHEWWFSPITNERFQVGRHDREEVKPKTENNIRKQAGVPKKR